MTPDSSSRLYISASNRLETLAEQLADEMRRHPRDPLAPERIVVPHPALGRWLRMALATELGVAANLRVELPAEFAWDVMRETAPALAAERQFAPASLRWRVFDLLGGDVEDDQLRRYLADAEPRKRFELADRLAHVYDRCLLYRPTWIRAWQAGDAPHWQARLWLALCRTATAPCHWVDAVDAYRQAAAQLAAAPASEQLELDLDADGERATSRASFFGMVGMSPSYLDMLRAAASVMDIHLYLLSPCREFWADIRSLRERPMAAADDDYFATGNELLAAWGRPARDMQALLADDIGTGAPRETYLEPAANTRLAAVQRDILDLRTAAEGTAADASDGRVPDPDDSVQIHVCHSAMREMEVLHDRLLGLFDSHPDIEPADVQVVASSLTDYAPAIEAVFGAAGVIPFNIGRLRHRDNAAVQAFLDLLALPGSRYAARAVLAPLRAAAVQACFGIDDGDLAVVGRWLDRAGIRWGIDAGHLQEHEAPAANTHTWRAGIQRLLLGYAIEDDALFKGVAPCAAGRGGFDAGSDDYECLGRFARYCEQALDLAAWAEKAQTPRQWVDDLRTLVLNRFFADDKASRDVDAVARLIDEFADECRLAESAAAIPFAVLRQVLNAAASEATRAVARLAEGVTVGQLAAGRIHPAKVVCAVGMNGDAFPRHVPQATFDLVGLDDRNIGDRDARDEDRFAFLEALLAARRCFIVTYTGRDLRDDAALPPSVLVSDLAEYLTARFGAEMETRHPLQPFSRRYFDDANGRLFSYSEAMAAAANAVADTVEDSPGRFADQLPSVAHQRPELDIDELVRFAVAPTRYFVEARLGMQLRLFTDEVKDEEPFEPDALRRWQVMSGILALRTAHVAEPTPRTLLLARGLLPQSNLGQVEYRQRSVEANALGTTLAAYDAHRAAPPLDLEIEIAGTLLVGAVGGYCADANEMLWWRTGAVRPRDRIEVWLKLLALACTAGKTVEAVAIGVTNAVQCIRLSSPAPDEAAQLLADWLSAWRIGNNVALPFFPATSWAWARAAQRPLQDARAAWRGNQWGEGDDEYNSLVFPREPFDARFKEWAERLLRPLVSMSDT